jgi:hypothetical protein
MKNEWRWHGRLHRTGTNRDSWGAVPGRPVCMVHFRNANTNSRRRGDKLNELFYRFWKWKNVLSGPCECDRQFRSCVLQSTLVQFWLRKDLPVKVRPMLVLSWFWSLVRCLCCDNFSVILRNWTYLRWPRKEQRKKVQAELLKLIYCCIIVCKFWGKFDFNFIIEIIGMISFEN